MSFIDFAMEPHARDDQTIEDFAQELYKAKQVVNVIGVYNNAYLYLSFFDTPERIIEQYHDHERTR